MSHRDWLICVFIVDLFRSRAALEAEVLVLRQQIVVLRRGEPTPTAHRGHRQASAGMALLAFPTARDALAVVRPETVLCWR